MKTTAFFTLLMSVIFGLAIMTPQNSKARDYRKTLPDCATCKMPVYSYYRFKTYENHKAVYSWQINGHSNCGLESESPVGEPLAAKQNEVKPDTKVKMASAKSAVNPLEKTHSDKKGKTADSKSESEETAYAHPVQPLAYGGGSGYVEQGAYGGPVYGGGHQCHSACNHGGNYGNGYDRRRGYEYGYGYGAGTVKRTVTVKRSTPSTTMYGGFPGSSTRTYSTRTRVTRRGGYGGFRGGGGYGYNMGYRH